MGFYADYICTPDQTTYNILSSAVSRSKINTSVLLHLWKGSHHPLVLVVWGAWGSCCKTLASKIAGIALYRSIKY